VTDSDVFETLLGGWNRDQRYFGVVVAIVTDNEDPENMHRVKLRFPWLAEGEESNWARVATPMAGANRGIYCLPEVDDEVLVAFEHGAANFPYVVGALWNGKDMPPESNRDGENNCRTFRSRSGHILRLNDQAGSESIEIVDKSGHNKLVIHTADNSLRIEAQGDIGIHSSGGKVTISAAAGIELKSDAGAAIEAAMSMELKAGAQMNLKGMMINLN